MLDDAELDKRFDRHRQTEATGPAFELMHATVKITASVLNQVLPPGREAALALTALQEVLNWSNTSIACNAGPEWVAPAVDVNDQLDELLELVEGPLHLRSQVVGGGGPVDEGSGGDIGPEDGRIAPAEPGSGEIVPEAGFDHPGVCGLCGGPMPPGEEVFRYHGYSGPCPTELYRRSGALPNVTGWSTPLLVPREGSIEPDEGAERLLQGDCTSPGPFGRCELVAGHGGRHERAGLNW